MKSKEECSIPENLVRRHEVLKDEVFNSYHTETALMRYIKKLERKRPFFNAFYDFFRILYNEVECSSRDASAFMGEWGSVHPFVPKDKL